MHGVGLDQMILFTIMSDRSWDLFLADLARVRVCSIGHGEAVLPDFCFAADPSPEALVVYPFDTA